MATQNALGNASAPFTVSSGDLTISSGNNVISSGNLLLPTTSSSVGQIQINSTNAFHAFGTDNIFVGSGAGNTSFNTSYNSSNVGVGYQALHSLAGAGTDQGSYNVALGSGALTALTSAFGNVGAGYSSGSGLTSGSGNCFIGSSSGTGITTGNYNVFIGPSTGSSKTTGSESSNILIGYGVAGTNNTSNELIIGNGTGTGNGNINSAAICGITGKTSTSGVAVYVNSSNVLGTSTSNRDSKQDIEDMGTDSQILYQLRPRKFKYKDDTDPKPQQYGMIAEEVEPICQNLVAYDKNGSPYNLFYQFIPPMLVNELQRLNERVILLEQQLAAYESGNS